MKASPEVALAKTVKDSKAPAISRAAAILRLLGKSEMPLGLQPIARELGLVPSTCLYVLRALVAEELVAFDPDTKRYSLQAGVLTLARQWLRRDQFHELAQPMLDRTATRFDLTMLGVQIVGLEHIVAVAVSQASGNFRLSTQVGSRFPALISATGRCIAAFGNHEEAELKARFDGLRWDNPPSYEEWTRQVETTRDQGYAIDDSNYIMGVTVIAVPVWKMPGVMSHALVATGLSGALERTGKHLVAQAMCADARALSAQFSID